MPDVSEFRRSFTFIFVSEGEQSNFAIRYFVKIHRTIFSFGQFPNLNTKFDINVLFEQFCERQKKRTCSTNFSREVGAS